MIQSTVNRVVYLGDGVTTGFAFPTAFLSTSDLKVWLQDSATGAMIGQLTLDTNYTLEGSVDAVGRYINGATVRTTVTYTSAFNIIIFQDPDVSQLVDLRDNGLLPVEQQIELPLDRLTIIAQRTKSLVLRTLRQPESDSADIAELPSKVTRASKFAAYDSNGNPIAAAGTSANLTPVSAFVDTLLDDADAATARATLGFPTISGKGELIAGTGAGTLGVVPNNETPGLVLSLEPSLTAGLKFNFPDQFNGFPNGDCDIWQNGPAFVSVANNTYTADMWRWNFSGGGNVNHNRSTNVPSFATNNHFYKHSLEVDVTTADAAIAAGDHYILSTFLEGYDWRFFAQRAFALVFLVQSPKTGVHSVAMCNGAADRSCIGTYTIDAANTWERKTVLFPASPAAGTWDYENGQGVRAQFVLAAGTTFHNTTATWHTGNYLCTSAQPNCMDSTSNFFRITDVRIVPGTAAYPPRFEPFGLRLARCQRYFQKSRIYGEGITDASGLGKGEERILSHVAGATVTSMQIRFPEAMRAQPVVLTWNPNGSNAHVRNVSDSADCSGTTVAAVTMHDAQLQFTCSAGTAIGEQLAVHWAADARFY